MIRTVLALTLMACMFAAHAQQRQYRVPGQDVYVAPHVRSDGTPVQGHYRRAPNDTNLDNWSTKGNFNPYTAEPGHRDPYAIAPQPNYPTYDPTPRQHHQRK